MSWCPGSPEPDKTLFERFLRTRAPERGKIRDEIVEMVDRSKIFSPDDLIQLMRAGYRSLSQAERDVFMRRVLLELKRSQNT
jgi:hypothetical protein